MKYYNIIKDAVLFILILLGLLYIVERYVFQIDKDQIKVLQLEKTINQSRIDKEKIKTLSNVLWCENRKSKTSMQLVLSVIINRAKEKTIDGLYSEVVKPFQFSCLNNDNILLTQKKNKKDEKMYHVAEQLISSFVKGEFNPVTTAKFYYAPKKVQKPSYLVGKPLLMAFEDHHFH